MKPEFGRPSRHGQYLGEVLVLLAREGRRLSDSPLPEPCITCAFRRGTLPNMTAGTGLTALNCVIGIDKSEFACHHGMKDGEPTKLCAGYAAALLAPFKDAREILAAMHQQLSRLDEQEKTVGYVDEVRADFDAWYERTDPDGKLDVYQLARAYAGRGS